MSEVKKTSELSGAKEKGIEERTYDLRSKFSDDEYGFLLSRVFDKFEDLDNELYLKVISNRRILSDDIEQLQSIIRDYLKVTSINDRYLMGTAILQKLFDLLRSEPSKVTEAEPQEQEEEPQEQEREESKSDSDCNRQNTKDFLINYLVTVYYVDGHSSFRSFSGCADGIVFNFQQNSLHLDDLENGNRSVFNMFNFPDSEEIVACDVSFTLIPYLPF